MKILSEDEELVLSIIKQWYTDKDAVYLAKEDQILFWGPINGDRSNLGWNRLKPKETIAIIRATKIPVGVMHLCSETLLQAAAQEEGRAFIQAVEVHGTVEEGYFNLYTAKAYFKRTQQFVTLESILAREILRYFEVIKDNIKVKDCNEIMASAIIKLKLPTLSVMARNSLLREEAARMGYVERSQAATYDLCWFDAEGKRQVARCFKHPNFKRCKMSWTQQEFDEAVEYICESYRTDEFVSKMVQPT